MLTMHIFQIKLSPLKTYAQASHFLLAKLLSISWQQTTKTFFNKISVKAVHFIDDMECKTNITEYSIHEDGRQKIQIAGPDQFLLNFCVGMNMLTAHQWLQHCLKCKTILRKLLISTPFFQFHVYISMLARGKTLGWHIGLAV